MARFKQSRHEATWLLSPTGFATPHVKVATRDTEADQRVGLLENRPYRNGCGSRVKS